MIKHQLRPTSQGTQHYYRKTEEHVYLSLQKTELVRDLQRINREMDGVKPNYKIENQPSLWERFVCWLGGIFS